jgi:hypothetical protein
MVAERIPELTYSPASYLTPVGSLAAEQCIIKTKENCRVAKGMDRKKETKKPKKKKA